jgi:hypothetical protein
MPRVRKGSPHIRNNLPEGAYPTCSNHRMKERSRGINELASLVSTHDEEQIEPENNDIEVFDVEQKRSDELIQKQQKEIEELKAQVQHWKQEHDKLKTQSQTVSIPNANIGFDYQGMYCIHRTVKFLNRARKVLWDRMEPGNLKHGRGLYLVACPWELLAFHFRKMPNCVEKVTKRTVKRRGQKYLVPFKWFMSERTLPDLGGRWSKKYFKCGNQLHKAFYTAVSFIFNTADDRVYCNWRSSSYMLFNGSF